MLDGLESVNVELPLTLEDADWEFLKSRVESAEYTKADWEILEMVESVLNAEKP